MTRARLPAAWTRLCLGAAVLALTMAACTRSAAPAGDAAAGDGTAVDFAFRFESPDHPRLRELAARERLDRLIDRESPPLVQIARVRDWVAGQWPAGVPDPYPPWDAVVILDWIRAGTTGGFCGQYAQVLLQSLTALGFVARYVEIGSIDNPYAHFVTEVWVPDLGKWVLMDADYNLHFERDGDPLGVLEIHDALLAGEAGGLTVVEGTRREGHSHASRWRLRTAELYHYVRFHLKADHLSAPEEPPFDRIGDMVEWRDDRVVPWQDSTVESPYPKVPLTRRSTADRTRLDDGPPE